MFKRTSASTSAIFAALVIGMLGVSQSAHAEIPAAVLTAITAVGTDGAILIGAMSTVGAAVYLISKLLRKFGVML